MKFDIAVEMEKVASFLRTRAGVTVSSLLMEVLMISGLTYSSRHRKQMCAVLQAHKIK